LGVVLASRPPLCVELVLLVPLVVLAPLPVVPALPAVVLAVVGLLEEPHPASASSAQVAHAAAIAVLIGRDPFCLL